MKKFLLTMAGGLLLTVTGSTSANDWTNTETFELGSFLLFGGDIVHFELELADNAKEIVGFIVEWDYFESVPDGSWASDAQATVTSPTGANYIVGGFTNVGNADVLWSFDGAQSDGPGHYGDKDIHTPWKKDLQPKGLWHFDFANDWTPDPNPNEYNNLTITFLKIPAPGALALLGVAGLIGGRRRRRG